jgi:hypothetical protein
VDEFIADLAGAVESERERLRSGGSSEGGMAPIYGLAGRLPLRGAVAELLRRYIDRLYER